MMPALLTRESVSVDLPWSTWAITDILRMLDRLSMIARTYKKITQHSVGTHQFQVCRTISQSEIETNEQLVARLLYQMLNNNLQPLKG